MILSKLERESKSNKKKLDNSEAEEKVRTKLDKFYLRLICLYQDVN